ncbi:IS630 transposase-related protein [Legionella santicrucis]|uniref:IS630 transposase-related protein n=1 Tax=Legionella santicrucis TaxID=45074 RepID=UPI00138EE798
MDDEALKKYIETHPDAHLKELSSHFGVTPSGIWRALKRLKITRKKRLGSMRSEMSKKEKII